MLALPQPLGQALIDYLKQRPYVEVYELIPALLALKPVEQPKSQPESKPAF